MQFFTDYGLFFLNLLGITLLFVFIFTYLTKIIKRNTYIKKTLNHRFQQNYLVDKIVSTHGLQSLVIRVYAKEKLWELTIDINKGITKERMLRKVIRQQSV